MDVEGEVARHYSRSELTRSVLDALQRAGRSLDALTPDDLAGVDEFHTGWGPQTRAFAQELALGPGVAVLDIGCGVGGPARHFAGVYGADVTGIDLTPAFVELATELTRLTHLEDRARFIVGSALALPFPDAHFDLATLIHVGMNIADKPRLFAETRRVLRPGGQFVIYDLMRIGEGDLPMPMPWADTPETSFVETPATYRALLGDAGLAVAHERDWTDLVLEVGRERRERASREGLPVVGLHLLMGPDGQARLGRVLAAIADRLIAPIEISATAD